MKLLIDFREKDRAKDAVAHFKYEPLIERIDILELQTGDFIFRNEDGKSVVFEYKTTPDFFSSINNGRLMNEAIDQQREFDYHYVVVEGTSHDRTRERNKRKALDRGYVSRKREMGMIATLNTFTTVIKADNQTEAFDYMLAHAKHCFENKNLVKQFNKSEGNLAWRFLCYCVHGVGDVTAENIVFHLQLETLDDLLELTPEKLMQVDGVGAVTAKRILHELKRKN